MTFVDAAHHSYAWMVRHQQIIFMLFLLIPITGTLLAFTLRETRNGQLGKRIAGAVITLGVVGLVVEVILIAIARSAFDAHVLAAPVMLVSAPVLGLIGALSGIHWVYPLNNLAAWRSVTDVALFVLASAALLWFMSKFRGWGILFGGSLVELALIGLFGFWLMRRLFRRAFKR